MWSSSSSSSSGWFSGVESAKASFQQALEKTGDALEKTGDVLTQAATNAGRQARATAAQEKKQEQEKAKGRYASVDEKPSAAAATTAAGSNNNNLLQSFQSGWSSVVESTKAGLLQAQQLVEEQQELLQQKMSGQIQPRDPSLPLDVAALQDANVVYLTDRILTLSHPAMASDTNGDITGRRKLAAVAHLLHKRHAGRFMIWNLSEVEYSDSTQAPRNNTNDKALPSVEEVLFDNQVLNYSFPGSPSPPLGLLLKLLVSLESWLRADAQNVAVIHCLTGKGRTSTVVAAFLCWMRQAGFSDVHETLAYIADCKQVSPVSDLTIPSQRRYATYFQNLLDQSIRPSQPPLLLKRVVLNQAPKFARGPGHASTPWDEEAQYWGCVPYLQLFKGGKLLFTAPATPSAQHVAEKQQREQKQAAAEQAKEKEEKSEPEKEKEGEDSAAATKPASEGASGEAKPSEKKTGNVQELPFCHGGDGSVHFDDLNQVVQGDVLLRCRHLAARGKQRISMFRAAFHTGYIGGTVLRLTKAQLDGACNDHSRFADDFYMDVIFEEATTTTTTTAGDEGDTSDETKTEDAKDDNDGNKKEESASAAAVTASADDVMLDRDSRFWDVIRKRQEEQKAEGDKKKKKEQEEEDPFWGPTVGRRRPMAHEKAAQAQQEQQADATKEGGAPPPQASPAFSIGGEFDFLPSEDASPPSPQKKTTAAAVKDSLMEALTGALDDDDDDDDDDAESSGMEEVVFFKEGEDDKAKKAAAAAAASSTKPATEGGAESTPATPKEASNDDAKTETTTTKDDSADLSTADVDQLLAGADALLADDGGVADAGDEEEDDDDDDLEDLETLLAKKK